MSLGFTLTSPHLGGGDDGLPCAAFQELGWMGAGQCLGIGIPILNTTRALITPG